MAKKKISEAYNEQEEELREDGDSEYTDDEEFEPDFMSNEDLPYESEEFETLDMDIGLTEEDAMLLDEADAPDAEAPEKRRERFERVQSKLDELIAAAQEKGNELDWQELEDAIKGSAINPETLADIYEYCAGKGITIVNDDISAIDHSLESGEGGDDVATEDDEIVVKTSPEDFMTVLDALNKAGFEQTSAEIERNAMMLKTLDKEKTEKVLKLVERLEELDDVQEVSHDLDVPDDFELDD